MEDFIGPSPILQMVNTERRRAAPAELNNYKTGMFSYVGVEGVLSLLIAAPQFESHGRFSFPELLNYGMLLLCIFFFLMFSSIYRDYWKHLP